MINKQTYLTSPIKAIVKLLSCVIIFVGISLNSDLIKAQVKATLSEDELLMGKLETLMLKVTLPSDSVIVEFPLLHDKSIGNSKYIPLLNDTIEINRNYKSERYKEGDIWIEQYELTLQAFDSGAYVLPPFEIIINGDTLKSNSLNLKVLPVKVKADDKLDDFTEIAAPFEILPIPEEELNDLDNENEAWIWWLSIAAIALGTLLVFLYMRYRMTGSVFGMKPLPVYMQAINKLYKLRNQKLPQKGKTKEYYTILTDILRGYLNREFKIKTIERTSVEILDDLMRHEDLSPFTEVLKSIFVTADSVKFAKMNTTKEENNRCWEAAYQFVEKSHKLIMEKNKTADKV